MVTPYLTLGSMDLDGLDEFGVLWVANPLRGWEGPASSLSPQRKPRSDGAWGGRGYRQPRTVVASGSVVAPSQALLEDALDRLNAAVSLSDTVLIVHGAARDRWAVVRRAGEVLAPLVTPTHADWSIQLTALDPRKFGAVLTGSTGLPSSTGGLTLPLTLPLSIGSTVSRGQVSLFNPGNVAGPVTLKITAPVTAPVVTHVSAATSPRALVFSSSLVLGAGQWVDVDMDARTVLENGEASRSGWVTSRGWSAFQPGWNTWSFAAGVFHADSRLDVTAIEAWE